MEGTIEVRGMVLCAMPIGEYDRRIVLLTKERGKLTVFVRGARRPSGVFAAATRPFTMGTFFLSMGKSAYTLRSVQPTEYFEAIANDVMDTAYGSYFLEFAGLYSHENMDGTMMLNLLYISIRALLRGIMPRELIRMTFEIRTMAMNGEFPDVWVCSSAGCQNSLTEGYYLPRRGYICCGACKEKHREEHQTYLSAGAIYALQHICSAPLGKLYTFSLEERVFDEVKTMMNHHKKRYITGEFKSLEVLTELEKLP